jgi:hypothetical protein
MCNTQYVKAIVLPTHLRDGRPKFLRKLEVLVAIRDYMDMIAFKGHG